MRKIRLTFRLGSVMPQSTSSRVCSLPLTRKHHYVLFVVLARSSCSPAVTRRTSLLPSSLATSSRAPYGRSTFQSARSLALSARKADVPYRIGRHEGSRALEWRDADALVSSFRQPVRCHPCVPSTAKLISSSHSDIAPVNAFPRASSTAAAETQWVFDVAARDWEKWIGKAAARQVATNSGCYSRVHPGTKLRIISVNTNYW